MANSLLASIGSVYLETNYLATDTAGRDVLELGKEYRSTSYTIGLGGSSVNFAVQTVALGQSVALIGKVGDDEHGQKIIALLKQSGIASELIHISKDVQTSIDTGVVLSHSGQNIQLVSGNANQTLSLADIPLDSPLLNEVTAVYLGGYFKQESLYADYPTLLKNLKSQKKQLFIDHGRVPVGVDAHKIKILKECLPYVDGYFLNDSELLSVTGKESLEDAVSEIRTWGAGFVVIKQGEQGCMVIAGESVKKFETTKAAPINTVGAGDAFNAAFISHYLAGSDIYAAAIYGNKVATYKVAYNVVVLPDMIDN
jgi:2-dehydro-3-deoxygluconokinase